ncbi:Ig-like domain-containing protein [Paenibacillus campi]|uniref:Ig-like domain-containing protein n=1 Tax=Paenibacillus campi TaxID=3106031 RepID=UPI002AFFD66A|nr:Ig-like domain-containing protein [Paenibacillus sp. SGZ-1014]
MTHTAKLGRWMLSLLLMSTLLFPSGVFAADTSAVSLKFADDNALTLSLDDNASDQTLYTVDGKGDKTDVTDEATWSSSTPTVAKVDKEGSVTPVSVGTATITAKYGDLAATKKVTVTSPYITLTLSQTEPVNVTIGTPYEFTATATKANGTTVDVTDTVTWSTYDSKVAKVVEGQVTGLSQGTTTLTAKYAGLTASTTLYVRSSFQGLILTPEDDQVMFIGQPALPVKGEVVNASSVKDVTADVTWTSSNPLNVTATGGLLTPWIEGTSTIKAQYQDFTKSFKVTVYKTMKRLEPSVTSIELVTGKSVPVPKVKGIAVDGTTVDLSKDIDWSIDSSVATINNNKLTAEDAGDVTLVGKVGNMQVSIPVSVKTKLLTMMPSVNNISVVVGSSAALPSVTAIDADGNTVNVTDNVEWTSSTDKLLIQGKNIKALVKGTASLKGTYLNDSVRVSVKMEGKIQSLDVSPLNMELGLNKSKAIKVVGTYTDGKSVTLSTKMNWVSSNPAVATVKGANVKTVGVGTTTLTGSYQGLSATVKITVSAQLKKLTASPSSFKLAIGTNAVATLTAEYDSGDVINVSPSAIWVSSNSAVATVTSGRITAVGKGSASIKAEYGGKQVTINVSVKDKF